MLEVEDKATPVYQNIKIKQETTFFIHCIDELWY